MDGGACFDECICTEKNGGNWSIIFYAQQGVVSHPSDFGETMPVRCTCGKSFGL